MGESEAEPGRCLEAHWSANLVCVTVVQANESLSETKGRESEDRYLRMLPCLHLLVPTYKNAHTHNYILAAFLFINHKILEDVCLFNYIYLLHHVCSVPNRFVRPGNKHL